jgi:hypothetical protein
MTEIVVSETTLGTPPKKTNAVIERLIDIRNVSQEEFELFMIDNLRSGWSRRPTAPRNGPTPGSCCVRAHWNMYHRHGEHSCDVYFPVLIVERLDARHRPRIRAVGNLRFRNREGIRAWGAQIVSDDAAENFPIVVPSAVSNRMAVLRQWGFPGKRIATTE